MRQVQADRPGRPRSLTARRKDRVASATKGQGATMRAGHGRDSRGQIDHGGRYLPPRQSGRIGLIQEISESETGILVALPPDWRVQIPPGDRYGPQKNNFLRDSAEIGQIKSDRDQDRHPGATSDNARSGRGLAGQTGGPRSGGIGRCDQGAPRTSVRRCPRPAERG